MVSAFEGVSRRLAELAFSTTKTKMTNVAKEVQHKGKMLKLPWRRRLR